MAEEDEQNASAENESETEAPDIYEPPPLDDPARDLLESWGLRPGRGASGWTLEAVSLDPHDPAACIDFSREADTVRVRAKLAGDEPSYGRVGPIVISHDVVDEALNVDVGNLLRLLVVWFKQRADTEALAALLQSLLPEPKEPESGQAPPEAES